MNEHTWLLQHGWSLDPLLGWPNQTAKPPQRRPRDLVSKTTWRTMAHHIKHKNLKITCQNHVHRPNGQISREYHTQKFSQVQRYMQEISLQIFTPSQSTHCTHLDCPIKRGSRTVPPSINGTPKRRQNTPKMASEATIRISHQIASSNPPLIDRPTSQHY
jgi:hypothetical protein